MPVCVCCKRARVTHYAQTTVPWQRCVPVGRYCSSCSVAACMGST